MRQIFRLVRLRLAFPRLPKRVVKRLGRGRPTKGSRNGVLIDFRRNRREIRLESEIRRGGE